MMMRRWNEKISCKGEMGQERRDSRTGRRQRSKSKNYYGREKTRKIKIRVRVILKKKRKFLCLQSEKGTYSTGKTVNRSLVKTDEANILSDNL